MNPRNRLPVTRSLAAQIVSGVRFLKLSALSFFVNFGLTVLLHEVCRLPEELAFAMALVFVFVMNFFALQYYVFSGSGKRLGRQFIVYSSSAVGFRVSEYLAFLTLHSWLRFDYRLVFVSIAVFATVAKFFYYRFVFEAYPREPAAGKGPGQISGRMQ